MSNHKLPGDEGPGDILWFGRQNKFEQSVIRRQVEFKRACWPKMQNGVLSKYPQHTYPHIMPAASGNERNAFFEGFSSDVLAYMASNDIAVHSEVLNLKSSQVSCINLLYPFIQDRCLATDVWGRLTPDVKAVTQLEFEYTGQDEASGNVACTEWLGEPKSGKRGQNRTSIDAAVFWDDTRGESHVSLIEWKYTERKFGTCRGYQYAGNRERCKSLDLGRDPASNCYLADEGPNRGRKYWDHMRSAGIRTDRLLAVGGCPFRGPFYQLMRQALVAHFLRESGVADNVEIVVLEFEGNETLRNIPAELKPIQGNDQSTVVDVWNGSVDLQHPRVRVLTAESLVSAYDESQNWDAGWRKYVRDRYGL